VSCYVSREVVRESGVFSALTAQRDTVDDLKSRVHHLQQQTASLSSKEVRSAFLDACSELKRSNSGQRGRNTHIFGSLSKLGYITAQKYYTAVAAWVRYLNGY